MDQKLRTETLCIQAGYAPESGEPRQIPIIQSTTFKYATSEDMGKLFDLEASGYFYSRLQNPTCDMVAAKICALEGGSAAMLTGSGQAANFYAMFNIASCGDHIVASSAIYGGTFNLISVTMKRMGIEATFVSPDSTYEEICAAIRPNTKLVFGETIANPALNVLDIEVFAKAAHDNGLPLIIDNTFPTPVNCRPIEWGADIVTHSTTKYMDGHGVAVGGCIVDSGKFDWTKYPDKFPGLCTPDDSYHGVTYTERFGLEGAFITKCTAQLMRDLGSIQSPQSAFYLNLGLESLPFRMRQHCENAQAIAEFLSNNEKVAWVKYGGLKGDKYYDLTQKYMPGGSCGVISFGLKGGRKAAETFMKNMRLGSIETHVADSRTCCLHPASATHRQMTDEQLEAAGVGADLIRLSCGLENKEDLIADLKQAIEKV
jgi:O-acetylhomoserine (thiol)-lyase